MDDQLLPWLRTQIAETERVAADLPADGEYVEGYNVLRMRVGDFAWPDRWNPVQVLAQCEAHTALLDLAHLVLGADRRNDVLRHQVECGIALAYQHNPGYQEAWRP